MSFASRSPNSYWSLDDSSATLSLALLSATGDKFELVLRLSRKFVYFGFGRAVEPAAQVAELVPAYTVDVCSMSCNSKDAGAHVSFPVTSLIALAAPGRPTSSNVAELVVRVPGRRSARRTRSPSSGRRRGSTTASAARPRSARGQPPARRHFRFPEGGAAAARWHLMCLGLGAT